LPKTKRRWPIETVIGWQIVSIDGPENSDCKSQLILVVGENDTVSRHLVCAGVGRAMAERFRELNDRAQFCDG